MGSSRRRPLACLTSSDGRALNQGHSLGGPGTWGRGPENRKIWQENAKRPWLSIGLVNGFEGQSMRPFL
eukprot:1157578-Pelagomonas_calceolata.AAC.2